MAVDVRENRYADLSVILAPLLRDADDLVAASVNGAVPRARLLRSQARQLGAYMMSQTRQFGAAAEAIGLAEGDADDPLTAMAAS